MSPGRRIGERELLTDADGPLQQDERTDLLGRRDAMLCRHASSGSTACRCERRAATTSIIGSPPSSITLPRCPRGTVGTDVDRGRELAQEVADGTDWQEETGVTAVGDA